MSKQNRTGSIPAIIITLCISGLFGFNSSAAYERGNSTYISIPIALIVTMLLYVLATFALRKTGVENLYELSKYSIGTALSNTAFVVTAIALVLFAAHLENRFLVLMQSCFFGNASLPALAFYFFIVPIALAVFGFETINRTAPILGIAVLVIHTILLINSNSSYQSYKIYPIAGDGFLHMSESAFLYTALFFPTAFTSLLCSVRKKYSVRSSVIAFSAAIIICGITQLLLSLAFTYDELAELFMPLYRVSMVTGEENFLLRLDKTSAFIWTTAALYTCGYLLCGAGESLGKSFSLNVKGKRLLSCILGAAATLICVLQNGGGAFAETVNAICKTMCILLGVIAAAVAAVALIKKVVTSRKAD